MRRTLPLRCQPIKLLIASSSELAKNRSVDRRIHFDLLRARALDHLSSFHIDIFAREGEPDAVDLAKVRTSRPTRAAVIEISSGSISRLDTNIVTKTPPVTRIV